jgi:hypothetical protein
MKVFDWMIGLIVSPRPSDCISLGFGHIQLGIPPKKGNKNCFEVLVQKQTNRVVDTY